MLGVAAIPVSQIQLGLADGGSEATGTSAHTAYTTIADEFGPGVNGPIIAVATLPEQAGARTEAEVLDAQAGIATDLMGVDGVSSVLPFGVSADTVDAGVPGRADHRPGRPRDRRHRARRSTSPPTPTPGTPAPTSG